MDNESWIGGRRASGPAKREDTRQRILKAARSVFIQHPFQKASLRKIGDAAGVKHPLIIHYFGSKAALFDEIVLELEAEILINLPHIVEALKGCGRTEKFAVFLRLLLEYSFQYPDGLAVIMLNLGETDNMKMSLPGFGRMAEIRRKLLSLLSNDVLGGSFQNEADMLLFVLILSIANFVGSARFHSKALGFQYGSPEYRQWVGEMFAFLFIPAMEMIYQGKTMPVSALMENCTEEDPVENEPGDVPGKWNKGEAARNMILKFSKQVFSRNPYHAASIGMIGRQGRFDHTLIHHYFPTKADLLESVARDIFEEIIRMARLWSRDFSGMPFSRFFTVYLNRSLRYFFEHNEVPGILMHNIAHAEHLVDLVGFQYLTKFHYRIYDILRELLPQDAPERNLRMWLYTLITVLYSLVGAPEYPSRLLGMDPESEIYRQWVLETLISIFLPVFSEAL